MPEYSINVKSAHQPVNIELENAPEIGQVLSIPDPDDQQNQIDVKIVDLGVESRASSFVAEKA